jgi:hypothetical protein
MKSKVIVTNLTTSKGAGRGKVDIPAYFPAFTEVLATAGLEVTLVDTAAELERHVASGGKSILIHLFNEEQPLESLAEFVRPPGGVIGVFNPPSIVDVIALKPDTHRVLTSAGIAMPERVCDDAADVSVFSNSVIGSSKPVLVFPPGAKLPADRYNTRHIDTAREFEGRHYLSCIRLMCVGQELVSAMIRLRDATEGNACVHNKNTPRDPALVSYFQNALVDSRMDELRGLARAIGECLPPGFFAHDVAVEAGTERLYVFETGLKFEDYSYREHLTSISADLPRSIKQLFSGEYPRASARAFLRQCRAHGWL